MKRFLYITLLLMLVISSCTSDKYPFPQADIEFDNTDPIVVHRYGKTLFELDTTNFQQGLKSISEEFSLFLDADLDDAENVKQLLEYVSDSQLITIYQKVIQVYPDLSDFELQLTDAFSRHQHFYPDYNIPRFYTYISDLFFESPVIIDKRAIVLAIDIYLGADFPLYLHLGLPLYKIRCMEPENKAVDVMKSVYLNELVANSRSRTLLDRMVEAGKMLAYLDAVLPEVHDSLKICYSESKLEWAKGNERNVWAFLIENELLYSTDYQIQTKMIQDGPFTTGFSNNSPARLGVFLGWQIVRSYLKNNPDASLQALLQETDAQKILNQSRYRP